MSPTENLFVLGLDDFHRSILEELPQAERCTFHGLLELDEIRPGEVIPIRDLVAKATAQLEAFEGPIDGIVGFWDFPINCLVPILSERFGLPHKPLEGVVACEHKYWARVVERDVVPDLVPPFRAVDPFAEDVEESPGLEFPFWIKPVMSYASYLGFRVDDGDDLHAAIAEIREHIHFLAEPFEYVLEQVVLPDAVRGIDGAHCIAEGIIGGRQCTLEGFVHDGTPEVYGIVDSLRLPGLSSFARYRYPSELPDRVQEAMTDAAARTIRALGLDGSAWNMEFFWDEDADRVWLLEVNSRLSESHADLFRKVDGVSNQSVMLDLALGLRPRMPHREGPFARAAKLFVRTLDDAFVEEVPSDDDLAALEAEIPDAKIVLRAQAGQWLSEQPYAEPYSHELAWCYLGADSREEIEARYRHCLERLRFRLRDRGEVSAAEVVAG